jgi:hypothetical protein
MNDTELDLIRTWDQRCGDNENTFFPVTIDRRRLLEYVDQLRDALNWAVSAIEFRGEISANNAPPRIAGILCALANAKLLRQTGDVGGPA